MKSELSAYFLLLLTGILLFLNGCTQEKVSGSPSPSAIPPGLFTQAVQTLTANAPTASPVPATASPVPGITPSLPILPTAPAATPTPEATALPSATPALPPPGEPSPTATLPPLSPTPSPAAPTAGCTDVAAYYGDVTIPDDTLLAMETDFVKTWKIRNAGTCSWGAGYQLVFAGGSPLNGPPGQPLPPAAPGETIQVSVNLRSPAQGGTYYSNWVFQNPGGRRFGVNSGGVDMIWAKIKVDWGPGVGPTAAPPPVNCAYQSNPGYITQLVGLINDARTAQGLKPLALQNQLSAAAQAHSADMACNNYFDHTGLDHSNWFTRIQAAGYAYSYASENIYNGNPAFGGDASGAFSWWMGSPVHRDNILSDKVTQIGIGYAFFASSKNGGFYTLNFARP